MAHIKIKVGTKARILDSAERLFAEHGFSETSLRLITAQAEVNLAAVNYHFGSKKALIQAVLMRYLERFMPLLDTELKVLVDSPKPPTLNQVFEAFVPPLMSLNHRDDHGTTIFLQLLGRGYIDGQGHLRWFMTDHFGQTLGLFSHVIRRAYPQLSDLEIFWRLHFTLGTVVFTMASSRALLDIARSDFNQHSNIEGLIKKMIPYLAAGMGAPFFNQSEG
jgi:AcrR family transcriptional regulator